RKTLINAARVQIFFGAQDADDLRYVSEQLGETSDVQKDVTRTKATLFDTYYTRSEHRKEVRRPLMRPDEIRTLDKNKVIILPRGELPILGTRNFYFADGQLAKRAFMPLPAFTDASRTKIPGLDASAAVPSPALPTIVPTTPAYRSGLLQTRLRRGATFAAKAGPIAPPPGRRAIVKERLKTTVAAAVPAYAAVDFSALAAKAVTTRIAPDKEAAVAAIMNKVRSLRANAADTESFDLNLSIVEDALPDLVD
ncbi:type IV secretory system conjugative DNA transfer family protein, partial [Mesorhizobium sp. M7D.F.Ca.US.004.01.2.1]|uniref:type IV secretory system conjugative DNA transfer family protein n=2 Tax=unclassified Mesorhizobium TaxID=325217 RepID=UPI000FD6196B